MSCVIASTLFAAKTLRLEDTHFSNCDLVGVTAASCRSPLGPAVAQ